VSNGNDISVDFLFTASPNVLENLQLTSLDRAAKARKQAIVLLDRAIQEESTAALAAWILNHREEAIRRAANPEQAEFGFRKSA
jgi:hypothetical protein